MMKTTKKQMKYAVVMTMSFILFMTAVVLLESNMISILGSSFLGLVGTVGMFYAGMKLDVFTFTEGSFLAKLNVLVNNDSREVQRNRNRVARKVAPASYTTVEIVDYQQKRLQKRRFEDIAYTVKAVS